MTYNVAQLKDARPGKTQETGGLGVAGLYRHPEAKNPDGSPCEMITQYDPLFGNTQSNAAVRLGFVRVGDAPEGAVKTIESFSQAADEKERDSLKGLNARLDKMEKVAEENDKLRQQVADLEAEKKARAEADEAAGSDSAPDGEAATKAAVDKFNSGAKLNGTELKLVATAEGVELTPELDTNKKITDAINAKRDAEKEGE